MHADITVPLFVSFYFFSTGKWFLRNPTHRNARRSPCECPATIQVLSRNATQARGVELKLDSMGPAFKVSCVAAEDSGGERTELGVLEASPRVGPPRPTPAPA